MNPWSVKGLKGTVGNPLSVRFEVYHCESLICQRFEGYRCESGLPLFKRKVTWNYINVVLTFNECKYGLIKFEPRVRKFVCKISLEGIVRCRRKFVTNILILTNLLFRKRLRNKVTSVSEMFDCSQTFSVDLLEFYWKVEILRILNKIFNIMMIKKELIP